MLTEMVYPSPDRALLRFRVLTSNAKIVLVFSCLDYWKFWAVHFTQPHSDEATSTAHPPSAALQKATPKKKKKTHREGFPDQHF